jgi:hypothetical protein
MAKHRVNLEAWTTLHFQNRFLQIYLSIQGDLVQFYKDKWTNITPGLQQVIHHDFMKDHHFNLGYFTISYDISTQQSS